MKPPSLRADDSLIDEARLTEIYRRIQLGDTSVTDDVYWLQLREDFVTGKVSDQGSICCRRPDGSGG